MSVELVAAPEVVGPEPTLDELAEAIRSERERAGQLALAALEHVATAGAALLEVRNRVEPGGWAIWLRKNVVMDRSTATKYMRVAEFREEIERALGPRAGIGEALRYLSAAGLDRAAESQVQTPSERRSEFVRLLEQGMTITEAARVVGVPYNRGWWWAHPEKMNAKKAREKERRRAQREAAKARAAKRAAKAAGGALSEAYSMAERMQDVLGRAEDEAFDAEARVHLVEAGRRYRQMRDEITYALGMS